MALHDHVARRTDSTAAAWSWKLYVTTYRCQDIRSASNHSAAASSAGGGSTAPRGDGSSVIA